MTIFSCVTCHDQHVEINGWCGRAPTAVTRGILLSLSKLDVRASDIRLDMGLDMFSDIVLDMGLDMGLDIFSDIGLHMGLDLGSEMCSDTSMAVLRPAQRGFWGLGPSRGGFWALRSGCHFGFEEWLPFWL